MSLTVADAARMSAVPTVKCERCSVTVETSRVATPGRCTDWRCPLNSDAVNAKLHDDWKASLGTSFGLGRPK